MQNLSKYLQNDGSYLSPKNGKRYKSEKALKSHLSYTGHVNPSDITNRLYKVECIHCKKSLLCNSIKKHEYSCFLNPINLSLCKVCAGPIKNYKHSKGTCSHSCSNKFFKHLRNKPENYTQYTPCWAFHKKECIICGEDKIVAVHHANENHDDNRVENLVPLCPTHHQYMHSRFKEDIEHIVIEYVKNIIKQLSVG